MRNELPRGKLRGNQNKIDCNLYLIWVRKAENKDIDGCFKIWYFVENCL
jgi:hypothetical protein